MQRPVTVGMLPGYPNGNIWTRMNDYGFKVDAILLYQDIRFLSFDYVKSFLDTGLQVQLVIEPWDTYPNLWALAGGSRDYELTQFFQKVQRDGRFLVVRFLHEFNGSCKSSTLSHNLVLPNTT